MTNEQRLIYQTGREYLERVKNTVEFVSYTGKYPNLCGGTLMVRINSATVIIPNALISGGGCHISLGAHENDVSHGPWSVDLSDVPEYEEYREAIEEVVNANVEWGCCGGCL